VRKGKKDQRSQRNCKYEGKMHVEYLKMKPKMAHRGPNDVFPGGGGYPLKVGGYGLSKKIWTLV
jgi:hypothetical protein